MRFFFYGTLLDDELRAVVIGRAVPLSAATLPGWRRFGQRGVPWPGIAPALGAKVEGGIVEGIQPGERQRLLAYEGSGFELIELETVLADGSRVPTLTFLPHDRPRPTGLPWRLELWQRRHRNATLRTLADWR